ncbi:MAG: low molecular weight phosphotyrosine protein phosphatase [Clostridiales bacterium]|nr:low molecular weight phosphotyrosine protein phosphatase [Clostridiales bacterium]
MKEKIKVLMVCHGNICRSPMAEFVLKDMVAKRGFADRFEIASAATSREEIGNDIHYGTRDILRRHMIPFSRRRARQIERDDYDYYDYLIGMDNANIRNMERIFGHSREEGKIFSLLEFAGIYREVADPWYTGNFDKTYEDVLTGCEAFLKYLGE